MSLIQFTTGDVLRSKLLDNGWYKWQITSVKGPYINKAQDGNNYDVIFTLIEKSDDLNGKEIKRVFSNKAISMMIPLICAVRGIKESEIKPEAFTFELDELVGKKIDGQITSDVYEGQLQNRLEIYAPYGTTSNTSAF